MPSHAAACLSLFTLVVSLASASCGRDVVSGGGDSGPEQPLPEYDASQDEPVGDAAGSDATPVDGSDDGAVACRALGTVCNSMDAGCCAGLSCSENGLCLNGSP